MRDDEEDYRTLARWLTDERVLEFYEGRDQPYDEDRVSNEYSPRVMAAEGVTLCFFVLDGQPVGYAQFYPIKDAERKELELDADYDLTGVFGTDQFIGIPA